MTRGACLSENLNQTPEGAGPIWAWLELSLFDPKVIALRISTAHDFTRDRRARFKKWRLFLHG